jgi:rhodanese-related sulfurtransferase
MVIGRQHNKISRDPTLDIASFFAFLQKSYINMLLFGVAVASGAMLLWPLVARLIGATVPQVGLNEAVRLINRRDALVIDVRDASEYAAGHIPRSRHIPASELDGRLPELAKFKERPILLGCQTGARAQRACAALSKAGFKEVFVLQGGIAAWQQAGMPLEK